ncbi:hypothetical protein IH799_00650, partial [candidate division KSB1 bacterium]|nr:hypothetical protein [candidate division KSB1 bacterium]
MKGPKKDEERLAATLYKLGNAYGNSVQAAKGIDIFIEAVTQFEKLNDPLMLARTHWSLALIFMAQTADLRDIPRSVRHLNDGAQALEEDPDVSLLAQIYFSLSFTSWMTVRPAEGIEWGNKTTVLARDHLLYQYFGAAGMVIGFNMARQGQVEGGLRLLEGIVRLALTVHQREAASIVSIAVIRLFNHLLDAVRSSEWMEKTEAIKEETVSSNWAAENLGMYVTRPEEVAVRIFVYCLSGELDKAKDGVNELQEVIEES